MPNINMPAKQLNSIEACLLAREDMEGAIAEYLLEKGWSIRTSLPGHLSLWHKAIRDQFFTCDKETALTLEYAVEAEEETRVLVNAQYEDG